MKRRFFKISGMLFFLVILAACGGMSNPPGMNMEGSPMLSATGGTTTGGSRMATVQVTETDFAIHASTTHFTPGTMYHFVVTNTGKTTHEFMIMPKSEGTMNGMSMEEMDRMALAHINTITPGETKTVDYLFPSSKTRSHPEFACYLPGHYEAGMKLGVTVG